MRQTNTKTVYLKFIFNLLPTFYLSILRNNYFLRFFFFTFSTFFAVGGHSCNSYSLPGYKEKSWYYLSMRIIYYESHIVHSLKCVVFERVLKFIFFWHLINNGWALSFWRFWMLSSGVCTVACTLGLVSSLLRCDPTGISIECFSFQQFPLHSLVRAPLSPTQLCELWDLFS